MKKPLRLSEVEQPEDPESTHTGAPIEPAAEILRRSFERCTLPGSHPALVLRDLTLDTCDLGNAALIDLKATRLELRGCRLTGADISGAVLRDVRFFDCQIRLGRAFAARFERCWFERCDLREAEFEESKFDRITFRDCDLRSARLLRTSLGTTDFRGSRIDGFGVSPDLLAGAIIAPEQADIFAEAMGLTILPAPTGKPKPTL